MISCKEEKSYYRYEIRWNRDILLSIWQVRWFSPIKNKVMKVNLNTAQLTSGFSSNFYQQFRLIGDVCIKMEF
jgi:hypothetical protein